MVPNLCQDRIDRLTARECSSPVPAHPDSDVQREKLNFPCKKKENKKFVVFLRAMGVCSSVRCFPRSAWKPAVFPLLAPSAERPCCTCAGAGTFFLLIEERRNSRKVGAGENKEGNLLRMWRTAFRRDAPVSLSLVLYALLFWTGESR